jgi:uncharacterized cupredoxin-like copper-binding protein
MPAKNAQTFLAVAAILALTSSGGALAAGSHKGGHGKAHPEGHGHGHAQNLAFGEPAEASEATRIIEITMGDNYFEPEKLFLAAGETVRFVVKNEGEFLHEFNIGTATMHATHQEEMMTMMEHGMLTATGIDQDMMGMDHTEMGMSGHVHDDPNSVLVEPGATQELVWKFAEATDLEFACNVPGHYDAGMMGEIEFGTRPQSATGS